MDLVNEDEIFLEREIDAAYYFTHGGCYEFYKIMHYYFPNSICMINYASDHCAVSYNNIIYDANGICEDKENFHIATREDIKYMQDKFGLNIKQLKADKIIDDIKNCNIKGKLY